MSSLSQLTKCEEKELIEWYASNDVNNMIHNINTNILDDDNTMNEWVVSSQLKPDTSQLECIKKSTS